MLPFALLTVLLVFVIFGNSWKPTRQGIRSGTDFFENEEQRREFECTQRESLHLDWPVFYVSISSLALPKDILSICSEQERKMLSMLCLYNGNSQGATKFLETLQSELKTNSENTNGDVFSAQSVDDIAPYLTGLTHSKKVFEDYLEEDRSYRAFVPRIDFHFKENRFNIWLLQVLRFDFGRSTLDQTEVAQKVNRALSSTLVFTIPAVILIFAISLWLVLFTSSKEGLLNEVVYNLLYFIDAVPLFWLSVIIILLAGAMGIGYSTLDFGQDSLSDYFGRYSLPIFALVLASIPYVSKQILSAVKETRKQPYIVSARAKGLSDKAIFINHTLPNASLPIITLFFDYLAYAFGGAFVVELVFSINGIGKLMIDSVLGNDLPTIAAIIIYLIVIKMLLTLLSDVVKYLVNPAIKY
ncbi:MAG: ABC transporter permease [Cyclobacteriaceae bacterium]